MTSKPVEKDFAALPILKNLFRQVALRAPATVGDAYDGASSSATRTSADAEIGPRAEPSRSASSKRPIRTGSHVSAGAVSTETRPGLAPEVYKLCEAIDQLIPVGCFAQRARWWLAHMVEKGHPEKAYRDYTVLCVGLKVTPQALVRDRGGPPVHLKDAITPEQINSCAYCLALLLDKPVQARRARQVATNAVELYVQSIEFMWPSQGLGHLKMLLGTIEKDNPDWTAVDWNKLAQQVCHVTPASDAIAAIIYDRLRPNGPQIPSHQCIREGLLAMSMLRNRQAAALYTRALQDPKLRHQDFVHLWRAVAWFKSEEYRKAASDFVTALDLFEASGPTEVRKRVSKGVDWGSGKTRFGAKLLGQDVLEVFHIASYLGDSALQQRTVAVLQHTNNCEAEFWKRATAASRTAGDADFAALCVMHAYKLEPDNLELRQQHAQALSARGDLAAAASLLWQDGQVSRAELSYLRVLAGMLLDAASVAAQPNGADEQEGFLSPERYRSFARTVLARIVAEDSCDWQAALDLAGLYHEVGRTQAATFHLGEVCKLQPKRIPSWLLLAEYHGASNPRAAVEALQTALKLMEESDSSSLHLAAWSQAARGSAHGLAAAQEQLAGTPQSLTEAWALWTQLEKALEVDSQAPVTPQRSDTPARTAAPDPREEARRAQALSIRKQIQAPLPKRGIGADDLGSTRPERDDDELAALFERATNQKTKDYALGDRILLNFHAPQTVEQIFAAALASGFEPSLFCYSKRLSVHAKTWDKFAQAYKELEQTGFKPNNFVHRTKMAALLHAKKMPDAIKHFNSHEAACSNAVIITQYATALVRHKRVQDAEDCFRRAQRRGVELDKVAYTALIAALRASRRPKEAAYWQAEASKAGFVLQHPAVMTGALATAPKRVSEPDNSLPTKSVFACLALLQTPLLEGTNSLSFADILAAVCREGTGTCYLESEASGWVVASGTAPASEGTSSFAGRPVDVVYTGTPAEFFATMGRLARADPSGRLMAALHAQSQGSMETGEFTVSAASGRLLRLRSSRDAGGKFGVPLQQDRRLATGFHRDAVLVNWADRKILEVFPGALRALREGTFTRREPLLAQDKGWLLAACGRLLQSTPQRSPQDMPKIFNAEELPQAQAALKKAAWTPARIARVVAGLAPYPLEEQGALFDWLANLRATMHAQGLADEAENLFSWEFTRVRIKEEYVKIHHLESAQGPASF